MKYLIQILFVFCLVNAGFSQTDKRLKGIEKDFEKILEAAKASGFAVAIVEGDKTIYAKGFGYRDYENKIPADENTLFAIGSTTKAFTSAVLGQLRAEGLLSFDESPMLYVPQLRFYNQELNNGINIRDIMSHQTGLPRHDYSWYLFPTFDKDSLIQRIQYLEPFTGLRQKWYYNNYMFLVQGAIAEKLTGKTWEENIRERFFKPLGMTRSNLSIDELLTKDNVAVGYELYKDSLIRKIDYYEIAGMSPAGSINSSVNEMSNWLKVWINNGKFGDTQIIPEDYRIEAMSSHSVIRGGLPNDKFSDIFLANYGYGWMISSYRGHYRVEHGGNINGFSARVAFYPTDNIGIVILTNQDNSPLTYMVRNTVTDRMIGESKIDWAKDFLDEKEKNKQAQTEEEISQNVKNTSPSHLINAFEGDYFNPGYGRFTIMSKGDSLFAKFKLSTFYLKHVHYNIFEPFEITPYGIDTTLTSPLRYNFSTNNAGEIGALLMNIEPALDHSIEFKHEPKRIEIAAGELDKYVGEYEISGMIVKIYTKENGGLFMFVSGQPEYTLLATGKDLFILKDLEGYKVQFTVSNGLANEIVLIQPNGTFKAMRK